MSRWCTWRDSCILIGVCDNAHSYIWHDALMYVTWLIRIHDMTNLYMQDDAFNMWHDSWMYVTWLIPIYNMTHWSTCIIQWVCMHNSMNCTDGALFQRDLTMRSCLTKRDDSSTYMTWRIDVREMTHEYTWHNALMYVRWLINIYDMTHWGM